MSAELAVEKSVSRKQGFTGTLATPILVLVDIQCIHTLILTHTLLPVATATLTHAHRLQRLRRPLHHRMLPVHFLSHSHLHSTLSQKPVSKSAPFRSQTQLDVNPHPSLIHARWTMFQMTSTRQLSMAQAVSEVRICFIHYPDILTQLLQGTASQAPSRVLPKLSWGNQSPRITL